MLQHVSEFNFFLRLNTRCMKIQHAAYPFIHKWAFGLFLLLDFVNNAVNIGVQMSA